MTFKLIATLTTILFSIHSWAEELPKESKGPAVQVQPADNNDVYNFYFQKGDAPGQVSQGGNVKTEKSTNPKKGKVEPGEDIAEEKGDESHYEKSSIFSARGLSYRLGVGATSTSNGLGPLLGLRYNINRYFELNGDIIIPPRDYSGSGSNMEVAIGGALTPIHISLFGWETLWISFLGGFFSGERNTFNGLQSVTGFYFGPRLRINIGENTGLEYFARYDHSENYMTGVTGGLSLDFKF